MIPKVNNAIICVYVQLASFQINVLRKENHYVICLPILVKTVPSVIVQCNLEIERNILSLKRKKRAKVSLFQQPQFSFTQAES